MKFGMKGLTMLGLMLIALVMFAGLVPVAYAGIAAVKAEISQGHGDGILWGLIALGGAGLLIGAVYTEGNYLSDVIQSEGADGISREKVTVLSGQNLLIGAVLGKITKTCPAIGTADPGNTGNGTCTDVTMGAKAKIGTYTLQCTATAANAGTFEVRDPDDNLLPPATVGVAYGSSQINFTLNDGAVDFIVGDIFEIDVTDGSGKVKALTPAAVDGSQDAYGILGASVDASGGDLPGFAIVRIAVAKDAGLVWPGGITAAQKAAALAQLEAKHIVARKSA